jgi:protein gp37
MPGKWRFSDLLPTGATVSGASDQHMPPAIFLNNRPCTTQRCMIWIQRDDRDSRPMSGGGRTFFFKQWGGVNKKKTGRELQGRTWDEMPVVPDKMK